MYLRRKSESILIQKAKQRRNTQRILIRNSHQFCRNTSLNGLKYIADKQLYPRERIFFGLAFITVVVLVGIFIQNVWIKWNNTPVLFGINPYPSDITQEPFPAVTICNLNVAYKKKAETYSIYSTEYAMLQMLCRREVNVTVANSISDWSNLNNFMTEIAQPCSSMILSCRFGSVKYNCSELFEPVITDEGLCCAFNKLHPIFIYNWEKENNNRDISQDTKGGFIPVAWSSESGYQENLPENKKYYPRPAVGVGETLGLSITLDVESDEYYCSSANSIGFKIAIDNPMKSPSLRENGLLLAPGQETKILLSAEKYESEQKLRDIHYKHRQCWFQDEKKLKIYSQYSKSSCETECLANLLVKHCGCISYFLPPLNGNESICSIYDATCVERMRITSKLTIYNATNPRCEEKCLPSCNDINYYPHFFSAPIRHDGFQIFNYAMKNMSNKYVEQNIVVVNMYHRGYVYLSYKQTVFFSGTDALSSIGGLISLFVGFSFMSFAEFVFYAVVKPFRETRHFDAKKKNLLTEDNTAWKIPIRKRYKSEFDFNFHRKLFQNGQIHDSRETFKQKLYNKRYIKTGVNNE